MMAETVEGFSMDEVSFMMVEAGSGSGSGSGTARLGFV